METLESGSKAIGKTAPKGFAVQINITEPTIIYSVQIHGRMSVQANTNITVQINGYDSATNSPNNTVYLSTPLNMSSTNTDWYVQEFPTNMSFSAGNYSLVFNATEMPNPDPGKYFWSYTDTPNNTALYYSEYSGPGWDPGVQNQPFLYKIDQKVSRSYDPEEINMSAVIDGNIYQISNGSQQGSGNLTLAV